MVMIQKNISFGVLTLHRKLGNVYKNITIQEFVL